MSPVVENNEKPNHELLDHFLLNEISSMNDAINGLIQTNILLIGAYFVFAWALIEKLNVHETAAMPNTNMIFFTPAFIGYALFSLLSILPIVIWLDAIHSARSSKRPFMDSDLSSTNLRSILRQRYEGYTHAQNVSFLGIVVAVFAAAFLAGALSGGF
jgi:hypothetical protein